MDWKGRSHFISVAAKMMRRILIDHARKRQAAKRDAGLAPTPRLSPIGITPSPDVLDVDRAVEKMAADYPRHARIVELRFFGGLDAPRPDPRRSPKHPCPSPPQRTRTPVPFGGAIRSRHKALPRRGARPDSFFYRAHKFAVWWAIPLAVVSTLLAAVLAGALSTWSASRRVERRLNEVRNLAHSVLFDVYDSISALPGSRPARRLVASHAQKYLDSLVREAGGDYNLARDLAESYMRLGDVRVVPYAPNLGNTAGALESYRKASVLLEREASRHPDDAAINERLSQVYVNLGQSLRGRKVLQRRRKLCAGLLQSRKRCVPAIRANLGTLKNCHSPSRFPGEIECQGSMVRTINHQHQCPIRLHAVALHFNATSSGGRDFQDIPLPFGLAFEGSALVDGRILSRVGVEFEGSRCVFAFRREISRDRDIVFAVVNRNTGGLDHCSTGEIAPVRNQFPGPVQAVMIGGDSRGGKEDRCSGTRKENFT